MIRTSKNESNKERAGWLVRPAVPADANALTALHAVLVGAAYDWEAALLQDRSRKDGTVTLLAEAAGELVGYLSIGSAHLDRYPVTVVNNTADPVDLAALPWWKLHALGVAAPFRRAGLATELLAEALPHIPKNILGLYGNVDLNRTSAISWYRRRGFYLAVFMPLPQHPGDLQCVAVDTVPGEAFFRGQLGTLQTHLRRPQTKADELAAAGQEMHRQLEIMTVAAQPAAAEAGFLNYAKCALRGSAGRCSHFALGPRPGWIYGWDPELLLSCEVCAQERLGTIAAFDSVTRCDRCKQARADTEIGWAAWKTTFVYCGLCSACRHR